MPMILPKAFLSTDKTGVSVLASTPFPPHCWTENFLNHHKMSTASGSTGEDIAPLPNVLNLCGVN